MVINLTKILIGATFVVGLTIAQYTPSYAGGITGGTTKGSDVKKTYNTKQKTSYKEKREKAYKILEKIDPTPYNAGTRLLKMMERVGNKKRGNPRTRGGGMDGSTTWKRR